MFSKGKSCHPKANATCTVCHCSLLIGTYDQYKDTTGSNTIKSAYY